MASVQAEPELSDRLFVGNVPEKRLAFGVPVSVCSFVSLKFTCYVCFVRPRHSREHTAGLLSAIVEAYGFSPTQVVCCGCPGLSAEVALVRYSEGSEQMVHTHLCGS